MESGNAAYAPRKEKLNRLGEAWCAVKSAGELERKLALEAEIFETADFLFGHGKTGKIWECAIGDFYEKDWEKFDADQGSLYAFMLNRLEKRALSIRNQESGVRRVKKSAQEIEREARETRTAREKVDKQKYVRPESFDTPMGDEDGLTLSDVYEDSRSEYMPHEAVVSRSSVASMLAVLFHFQEHLHGHANNPDKRNYYRMFYTDSMVDYIHGNTLPPESIAREREMFEAMKLEFLDFFMRNKCRTAAQIADSPLKAWGELVPGRPMEKEPAQPLPNDVYLTYLNDREGKSLKSESAIANQRTAYKAFLREILGDYRN
ncbi:MAG: hypothetical protein IKO14_00215 [Oscillibacter sp.]|nr:hypothetical protein [Oscillibacter sp.]